MAGVLPEEEVGIGWEGWGWDGAGDIGTRANERAVADAGTWIERRLLLVVNRVKL
jgi:hypothetical protein